MSNVFSGRPILRTSSGKRSTSVLPAVSSVFAGSSCTTCAVAHSSTSRRACNSVMSDDFRSASRYSTDDGSACVFAKLACRAAMPSGRGRAHEGAGRIGGRTVPVEIELLRHLADGRADGERVEIEEADALAGTEILVGDVAAADHGDQVVGRERLVVHAPVQAPEVGQVAQDARPALHERVVQAHLDVRMRLENGDRRVEAARVAVVEQEANSNAALGRLPERLEQEKADLVCAPDVVLHIQRLLRSRGQQHAARERVARLGECVDARRLRTCGSHGRAIPLSRAAFRRCR